MNSTSVYELVRYVAKQLHSFYPDTALQITHAWWLIQAAMGKSKSELIQMNPFTITANQMGTLKDFLQRHTSNHEPLAYIIGSMPFGHLTLVTRPPILIPRPETEEWVLYVLHLLQPVADEPLKILDMGTGSGCIGLSCAQAFPRAHVWLVDQSVAAGELAQENAHKNGITNVTIVQSDLFEQLTPRLQFDCIVTNPPYIAFDEQQLLEPSVVNWEDHRALFADDDGLAIIQRIIVDASKWLEQHSVLKKYNLPQLVIEVGYTQADIVSGLLRQKGWHTTIWQDSAGHQRVVMATRSP
jgi:release factor glutamine methyltransferase